nr:hypothetical protein [Tanacetum cinerariifolium]
MLGFINQNSRLNSSKHVGYKLKLVIIRVCVQYVTKEWSPCHIAANGSKWKEMGSFNFLCAAILERLNIGLSWAPETITQRGLLVVVSEGFQDAYIRTGPYECLT